ncbi:hypothetical protein, partial [Lacimonas salitolerans]
KTPSRTSSGGTAKMPCDTILPPTGIYPDIDASLLSLLASLSQEDQKRLFDFLAILRTRTDG